MRTLAMISNHRPSSFGLVALILGGCAADPLEAGRFEAWVGRDRQSLVEHWGEPVARSGTAAGGERLTFPAAPRADELMPFQSLPPQRNVFGRDRSSPAIDLRQTSPAPAPQLAQTPPCLVVFETAADAMVTGWALEGGGCP